MHHFIKDTISSIERIVLDPLENHLNREASISLDQDEDREDAKALGRATCIEGKEVNEHNRSQNKVMSLVRDHYIAVTKD